MSELIQRITRVAGQDFDSSECRVTNPHITARESIELADYIVSLQKKNLALAAHVEALRKAGNQVINYGLSAAHWPSAIEVSAQHHLAAHDAEVAANAVADACNLPCSEIAHVEAHAFTNSKGVFCDIWLSSSDLIRHANNLLTKAKP